MTNLISSLIWISIVITNFKSHMSARILFIENNKLLWRCVKCLCKTNTEHWTVKTDKFSLFVYCNFLVLLSTTVCSQNRNKQIVNIADETLTDYSFLSRYHYTKSKNYLKRQYWICYWIPMFIGTPCIIAQLNQLTFSIQFVSIKGCPSRRLKYLDYRYSRWLGD